MNNCYLAKIGRKLTLVLFTLIFVLGAVNICPSARVKLTYPFYDRFYKLSLVVAVVLVISMVVVWLQALVLALSLP